MPLAVGVPLIVNVLAPELYVPVIPAGNAPAVIEAPVPVPPTVYTILVKALLIQSVGLAVPDVSESVASAFTVTVAVTALVTVLHGAGSLTRTQ